jgi:hypothetical protein
MEEDNVEACGYRFIFWKKSSSDLGVRFKALRMDLSDAQELDKQAITDCISDLGKWEINLELRTIAHELGRREVPAEEVPQTYRACDLKSPVDFGPGRPTAITGEITLEESERSKRERTPRGAILQPKEVMSCMKKLDVWRTLYPR